MVISAIAKIYGKMIIAGNRTFDSVDISKKAEVAQYLIDLGREDLITDPSYLPIQDSIQEEEQETI